MNWTGYTIGLPDNAEGHRCQITGQWQPEKYDDRWWWKCLDCTESAGVLSDDNLHELEAKGFLEPPNDSDEDLSGDTKHPDEGGDNDWRNIYGRYY
jgi:hypothetical protein